MRLKVNNLTVLRFLILYYILAKMLFMYNNYIQTLFL